ncbi:MAG: 30S ribosomal protein S5 [Candidatus Shikimatogenerans sp. AspAUS03]|uniref:Small ribosomal subunit protein uS5 n=1 Tax=Candidatus Shikimatogenerans sp. AspAUS03 TaxID=3158563 RepID=A0AAU7QSW2_9FLAO
MNTNYIEKLIKLNKVCKVTKGRRCFSFNVIVVRGNTKGLISYGLGKSKEILDAINKANFNCRKNLIKVLLYKGTIPYKLIGKYKKSIVKIFPARNGIGIIANKYIKLLFYCLGLNNVYCKSIGSRNCHNIIKATFNALKQIKSLKQISRERNITINNIINYDN